MMSFNTISVDVSARTAIWEEYVRGIGHNEEFALAALMHETGPLVYATARRFLNFREDAEDVVADVYAQVWRTAATYDAQRGNVIAWLIMIARSRAIDRLRTCGPARLGLKFAEDIPDNVAYDTAFEIRDYVSEALQRLPFEHRRAIELAYFSGFTMSEIADLLGHPLGTVKSRIRTALTTLRRSAHQHDPGNAGLRPASHNRRK